MQGKAVSSSNAPGVERGRIPTPGLLGCICPAPGACWEGPAEEEGTWAGSTRVPGAVGVLWSGTTAALVTRSSCALCRGPWVPSHQQQDTHGGDQVFVDDFLLMLTLAVRPSWDCFEVMRRGRTGRVWSPHLGCAWALEIVEKNIARPRLDSGGSCPPIFPCHTFLLLTPPECSLYLGFDDLFCIEKLIEAGWSDACL